MTRIEHTTESEPTMYGSPQHPAQHADGCDVGTEAAPLPRYRSELLSMDTMECRVMSSSLLDDARRGVYETIGCGAFEIVMYMSSAEARARAAALVAAADRYDAALLRAKVGAA